MFFTPQRNLPSANLAMSCKCPPADPRSSSWSPSGKVMSVPPSGRSVTWPILIGRPASSKPFNCSKARRAHSESENYKKSRPYQVPPSHRPALKAPEHSLVLQSQENGILTVAQTFLSQGMSSRIPSSQMVLWKEPFPADSRAITSQSSSSTKNLIVHYL